MASNESRHHECTDNHADPLRGEHDPGELRRSMEGVDEGIQRPIDEADHAVGHDEGDQRDPELRIRPQEPHSGPPSRDISAVVTRYGDQDQQQRTDEEQASGHNDEPARPECGEDGGPTDRSEEQHRSVDDLQH
nr:hypothetical protein [Arachnia propionica]